LWLARQVFISRGIEQTDGQAQAKAVVRTCCMILLLEDNPGDILLVQKALQKHHIRHRLHVIRDGEEALAYVARIGKPGGEPLPDLVLLDLNLPKADGAQILSAVRRHPDCAELPVIVVSSSGGLRDRARMAQLGITRYFRKPLDFEEFMKIGAIVEEVVGDGLTPADMHRLLESSPRVAA
jgi:chemotaxis family two-component system response regulator Rcp1